MVEIPDYINDETLKIASDGTAAITLPWAHEALTADFFRVGADLLMVAKNGDKILIEDYFLNLQLQDVLTAGGAKISANVIEKLCGNPLPGVYAQGTSSSIADGDPIGRITLTEGIVRIKRSDGAEEEVEAGAAIFEGDVVETNENSSVGIEFEDKTTLSLGADARMVLDEFVYNPAENTGNLGVSVLQGAFAFVSGEVAKLSPDAMTVTTPTATIGIRGTKVAGIAAAEGELSTISLLPEGDGSVGVIAITNDGGSVVLTEAGATIQLTSFNQAPPPPIILSPTEISSKFGGALNALPPSSSSPSNGGQSPDEDAEGDQGNNAGEDEVIDEAIEEAKDITEGLKQQAKNAQLEGKLAAQRLGERVNEARADLERFSVNLDRDIRQFGEQARDNVLRGEEVTSLSRDFGSEVAKFSAAIESASVASSLASSAEVLAAQALTIATLGGSPDEQVSRLEALGAASAVSSAAAAQIQILLALSTTAARGEAVDPEVLATLNNSTAQTLDAATSSATAVVKSIGAIAAEAYTSSWRDAKQIRGLNNDQAQLKSDLSINPFKGLLDTLTKTATDAGNIAAEAAEVSANQNNATPAEVLLLKDEAFQKASAPYEALKTELSVILGRAASERIDRSAIEQEAADSASSFAAKAANISNEIGQLAEQTGDADGSISQSAKMAVEAVNAAVSSAASASETVRLGVIAGQARDQAFANARGSGKSGADALEIANAVAKGYADAAKASASAAKKSQETAQSATSLAGLARNGQIAEAEFAEFSSGVSSALAVADEFITTSQGVSIDGLSEHIATVEEIINAGGGIEDAETKSLERLDFLKAKIDLSLDSLTNLSGIAEKANSAGGAKEKIEFEIDATAADEILELLSDGAFADAASSQSDTAISASVDAAAAADAFVDGSAQKSVTEKQAAVNTQNSIKDETVSALEAANISVTEARSGLVELLVDIAQKNAVVEALEIARVAAQEALQQPEENFQLAQAKLTQEELNLSNKKLELAEGNEVLSTDPLNELASANVDLAQAAVDLATQLTSNATAELSFNEQIRNLFENNLSQVDSDLSDAMNAANAAQDAVANQQELLADLELTAANTLDDALAASDDLTSSLSELAQAEGFLSVAQSAAVTQAELQVGLLIVEAFSAVDLAKEAAAEAKSLADAAKFDATEGSHPDKPGTVDKAGAAEKAELASEAASRATAARELAASAVEEAKLILEDSSSYASQDITAVASRNAAIASAESAVTSAEAAEKFAIASQTFAQTAADLAAILNPEPVTPDELKQQLLADQAQLNFARAENDAELAKQLASQEAAAQAEIDKQNADINAEVSVVKILSNVELISDAILELKEESNAAASNLKSLVQESELLENFEDQVSAEIGNRLGVFTIEKKVDGEFDFTISAVDKNGALIEDGIFISTESPSDNITFGAFRGEVSEGNTYSINIDGSVGEYIADGNEVGLRDVLDGLIADIDQKESFSFGSVSDLISTKIDDASVELEKLTNIDEQISILSSSVDLATQSAIKTASGAGLVDGLLLIRSLNDVDKHNITATVAESGAVQDNTIDVVVGGSDAGFSAVRINGSVETGDKLSVVINGQEVSYLVSGLEANLNAVRDGLVASINANLNTSSVVLAASGVGAAAQVNNLVTVSEAVFTNSNLAEQNLTSSSSEFLDGEFAADLQSAEELADKLAEQAEFDANVAAEKALSAAQAVADQDAADRLAEQIAATKLASSLAEQAAEQASDDDPSTLDALQARNQAEVALENLDAAGADAFANAAKLAADIAQAASDAAAQAALGKGIDAINAAANAAEASLRARISSSEARAFAELAEQNVTAVEEWVSGASSQNRIGAAEAASEAAATASSVSNAAKAAIAIAEQAIAAAVAPNVSLASAKAIVASRLLSLEEVTAQRALADDGNDSSTNTIEAVWDASIQKATSALNTAQDGLVSAQSAADAANEAASIAQTAADAALVTAQNAAAVAAQAAAAASFAATFEIGAQGLAQIRADKAIEFIGESVADLEQVAVLAAQQAALDANDARDAAKSAVSALDDTEALNLLIDEAQLAFNSASEQLTGLLNSLTAEAVKLNLNLENSELETILDALKLSVDDAATLDDIDASVNTTEALKAAQESSDLAQLSEVASVKAVLDAISKAIESTEASKTLAESQLEVTIAARDDAEQLLSLQVAAAIEELNSVKADLSSFAEKTTAFEAKAASAFKTGETRIEDIKSAILASESAQNSAKIALTAADAAEISLENSITQKNNAEDNAIISKGVFESASTVSEIDPELFEEINQLNSRTQSAFEAITSAVADAQSATTAAQTASSEASAASLTAIELLSELNLSDGETTDEKIEQFSSTLDQISVALDDARNENIIAQQQLENVGASRFNLTFDADISYTTDDLSDIESIISEAKEFLEISALASSNGDDASNLAQEDLLGINSAAKIRTAAQSAADSAASAAATAAGVAQADIISISGTIEAGDAYNVTLNNKDFNVTVDTHVTIADVVSDLVSKINDPDAGSSNVIAAIGNNEGELILTAKSAGVAFKADVETINVEAGIADNTASVKTTTSSSGGATQVAQVDAISILGTTEVGDVYGLTINDELEITYTVQDGDTLNKVRTELLDGINSNDQLSEILIASEGEDSSELILTARSAGSEFSTKAIIQNVESGINDNQIILNTTTQNLLGADELAAAAEVESLAAAAIIVQQIDEITVKSQQADVVVEANNSKIAITTLNEDLQALLFDDDVTTSDVNQNAILITNNSELAAAAASIAVEKAQQILNLEDDDDGSIEAALRESLTEAQIAAVTNADQAQLLLNEAENARLLAADKVVIAAKLFDVQTDNLTETEILSAIEGKLIALEQTQNLPGSADTLLRLSNESLGEISQLIKSADTNLVAAAKSVENANAQAALAEGVEDDLENLLAQAEATAIAQADDDAEVLAENAENFFSVAVASARNVFDDISTALDSSQAAFSEALEFENSQGGSSIEAIELVEAAVSSLQNDISTVLDKEEISGSDGAVISQALDDLVLSVDEVVNQLDQKFLISLDKTLTTENVITISIKGAEQDTASSITLDVSDQNLPNTDDALEDFRDDLINVIRNNSDFNDVITVESGFGFGDIIFTSASKTDDLFEISVSEDNGETTELNSISTSAIGIENAIRSINEGMSGLSSVASTIQEAVTDAETSSQLARDLANQIDKNSDPQLLTSAEAQEKVVTIQNQEAIAKGASDLSVAQQFVGSASLTQVQSGENQLSQNFT